MNKNKTYSNFKFEDLREFNITFESSSLFSNVIEVQPSEWLLKTLKNYSVIPKGTEKAKSEMIIVPILSELMEKNPKTFNFFSGYNFDVDKEKGLKGHCDFLLTLKYNSIQIESPIFSIVEAKRDDFEIGTPQCAAEMYAAQLFNARKNNSLDVIYGAVTIGTTWRFLKLENNVIYQDIEDYTTGNLPLLLGVLQTIIDFYKK